MYLIFSFLARSSYQYLSFYLSISHSFIPSLIHLFICNISECFVSFLSPRFFSSFFSSFIFFLSFLLSISQPTNQPINWVSHSVSQSVTQSVLSILYICPYEKPCSGYPLITYLLLFFSLLRYPCLSIVLPSCMSAQTAANGLFYRLPGHLHRKLRHERLNLAETEDLTVGWTMLETPPKKDAI